MKPQLILGLALIVVGVAIIAHAYWRKPAAIMTDSIGSTYVLVSKSADGKTWLFENQNGRYFVSVRFNGYWFISK